jgi:transcriptional regulator with XRE-family HTH domain
VQGRRDRLREVRKRRLHTQEELAELAGVAPITVRRWEAGIRPQPLHLRRLCDVLQATPAELGFTDEDVAADGVAEALALATLAEASEAGSGAIESILGATQRLRREYSRTPPEQLVRDIRGWLRVAAPLLRGRLRLAQHRDLSDAVGWLALLLGTVHFDVDQTEPAYAWRDAALVFSLEVGDRELESWAWETVAWFALAERRFRDTVGLTQVGLEVAPRSSVRVALHLQQARAWARLGDAPAATRALRNAGAALEPLPDPADLDDHYVSDPVRFAGVSATVYALLGLPGEAEQHARQVIAQSGDATQRNYWPTRVGTAWVEVGFALAQQRKIDEAAHEAGRAFETALVHRASLRRASELDAFLSPHAEVSEVRDFHERLIAAWRAQLPP